MPIGFACRNCGKRYRVENRHAGRQFQCHACGSSNTIPPPIASWLKAELPAAEELTIDSLYERPAAARNRHHPQPGSEEAPDVDSLTSDASPTEELQPATCTACGAPLAPHTPVCSECGVETGVETSSPALPPRESAPVSPAAERIQPRRDSKTIRIGVLSAVTVAVLAVRLTSNRWTSQPSRLVVFGPLQTPPRVVRRAASTLPATATAISSEAATHLAEYELRAPAGMTTISVSPTLKRWRGSAPEARGMELSLQVRPREDRDRESPAALTQSGSAPENVHDKIQLAGGTADGITLDGVRFFRLARATDTNPAFFQTVLAAYDGEKFIVIRGQCPDDSASRKMLDDAIATFKRPGSSSKEKPSTANSSEQ